MLYPEMTLEKLTEWAKEHGISDLLHVPAKMLTVKNSKYYSSWLWLYQQSNTPIQTIITRTSSIEIDELTADTAPLEYQQAAIVFLHEALKEQEIAVAEEKLLLQELPPSAPVLEELWHRLHEQRKNIRLHASPTTRKSRYAGRLLFQEKQMLLRYKEESLAWCGNSQWPEITIPLEDSSQMSVRCNCLRGNLGKCSRLISAIDHCLEFLKNPSHAHTHDKISNLVSKPKWKIKIEELESILEEDTERREGELLGWRIKEQNKTFHLEPIWCLNAKGQWKTRRADLEELLEQSFPIDSADSTIINLLHLLKGHSGLAKEAKQSLIHQTFTLLIEHPRVFHGAKGKHPIRVEQASLSLFLHKIPSGIELEFHLKGQRVFGHDLISLYPTIHGNLLLFTNESACNILHFNNKKQSLIKSLSQNTFYPTEALSQLFSQLHSMQNLFTIRLDPELREEEQTLNHQPCFYLECNPNGHLTISAKIKPFEHYSPLIIGVGEQEVYSWHDNTSYFGRRDFQTELQNLQKALQVLQLQTTANNYWQLQDPEEIFKLIQRMQAHQNIDYHWYSKKPRILSAANPSDLKIDIFNKNQAFTIEGTVSFEKQQRSLLEILPLIRKDSPYLLVEDNTWYTITDEIKKQLLYLADSLSLNEQTLYFYPEHKEQLRKILQSGVRGEHSSLENIDSSLLISEPKEDFIHQLRPYQRDGLIFLMQLHQWTTGAILADEMGLGKTIQSLAFIHNIEPTEAIIIIAPKSVLYNWICEIEKALPDYQYILYSGKDRSDKLLNLKSKSIILASYTVFARDSIQLSTHQFSLAILDEAQTIKNPETERAKACYALKARFKLLLSGTPIENNLFDLWSLFHCALPNLLGSWKQFRFRFVSPIQSGKFSRIEDLNQLISPFFLRRKKSMVAKDLPEKIEINEFVTLSDFEMEYYQEWKEKALQILLGEKSKIQILATITKLRQLSCHRALVVPTAGQFSSKLQRVLEIMEELQSEQKKVLIFSQFVSFLKILRQELQERGWKFNYLDGSTSFAKRQEEIETFQNDQAISFFLLSLKAGGTGLNLSCATEVIHLDPWWNPATEDQASDRVHRIGQTQPVTIIRMISRHTIEEKILQLHQKKRLLAENILANQNLVSLEELHSLLED